MEFANWYRSITLRSLLVIIAAFSLASCGGGGGGNTTPSNASTPNVTASQKPLILSQITDPASPFSDVLVSQTTGEMFGILADKNSSGAVQSINGVTYSDGKGKWSTFVFGTNGYITDFYDSNDNHVVFSNYANSNVTLTLYNKGVLIDTESVAIDSTAIQTLQQGIADLTSPVSLAAQTPRNLSQLSQVTPVQLASSSPWEGASLILKVVGGFGCAYGWIVAPTGWGLLIPAISCTVLAVSTYGDITGNAQITQGASIASTALCPIGIVTYDYSPCIEPVANAILNIAASGSSGSSSSSTGSSGATVSVVNGSCGSANATTVASAPTSGLCSAGTASAISGSGPWTWSCVGSGGGTTASCSALVSAASSGTVSETWLVGTWMLTAYQSSCNGSTLDPVDNTGEKVVVASPNLISETYCTESEGPSGYWSCASPADWQTDNGTWQLLGSSTIRVTESTGVYDAGIQDVNGKLQIIYSSSTCTEANGATHLGTQISEFTKE